MKTYVPDYYNKFKCIASRCRHSCCIGWEIDIDPDTLKLYKSVDGELGKRLKDSICLDGQNAYFKLSHNERCPFLNDTGLCDIITTLGEDALCRICNDHPRFRNFYSGGTEMGLGLCCEEAARLILSQTKPFTLPVIPTDDQDEKLIFTIRKAAVDIMTDREFTFNERIENLCDFFGIELPNKSIADRQQFFMGLEMLDSSWAQMLQCAKDDIVSTEWDIVFEQLICYFLFRHIPGSLNDGRYKERMGFCVLACNIIRTICSGGSSITFEGIVDVCRAFSSEIEYSDENLERILETI